MLLGKNILAVIAVLLVSVEASSPNLGNGTYTYDAESIAQNERILRLFLKLASETANQLISLKNKAENRQRNTTESIALRMQPDDAIQQSTIKNQSAKKSEEPNTKTRHVESEKRVKLAETSTTSAAKDSSANKSRTISSSNVDSSTESMSSTMTPGINSTERMIGESTSDQPVAIESRMMVNVETSNKVSHEQLKTSNSTETKVTTMNAPLSNQSSTADSKCIDCPTNGITEKPKSVEAVGAKNNSETLDASKKSGSAASDAGKGFVQSEMKTSTVSHQTLVTVKNLESQSKNRVIEKESKSVEKSQMQNIGLGRNDEQRQIGQSSTLSSKLEHGSKAPDGKNAIGNLTNQMTTSPGGNDKTSTRPGVIGRSLGILSTVHPTDLPKTVALGVVQTVPLKAASGIVNVGVGTPVRLLQTTVKTGSRVIKGVQDPALSLVKSMTGQTGKVLDGITGEAATVLDKGIGAVSNVGTTITRDDTPLGLIGSTVGGVAAIGSDMVRSLPLFRSFPGDEDESSRQDKASRDIKGNRTEHLGLMGIAKDGKPSSKDGSHLDDRKSQKSHVKSLLFGDDHEKLDKGTDSSRVMDSELKDFTIKFVNALRPINLRPKHQ